MYGLKWDFNKFMDEIWPLVTSHPNNVVDFAVTQVPDELTYRDQRRSGLLPEIPVAWLPSVTERGEGQEMRTFRLYGPLAVKGNAQFGSVQCRVAGNRESEKERATTSSWGFGRGIEEIQARQQALAPSGDPEAAEETATSNVGTGSVEGAASEPRHLRQGPDPLQLGIPGAVKIITYQTLTHTLKAGLTGNYSGVCDNLFDHLLHFMLFNL